MQIIIFSNIVSKQIVLWICSDEQSPMSLCVNNSLENWEGLRYYTVYCIVSVCAVVEHRTMLHRTKGSKYGEEVQ